MVVNEIELEEQLKEVGCRLLDPPSSTDELLNMLDKLEHLLINVEQAPSRSMKDALLPPMKALISNALLRNSDADVKVSVASCFSEITRITAPDAPYNDDHMKEIFQLIVAAIENLSDVSSRSYVKAVSILDTIAKVRSCLMMLDLELDELIIKMFQYFFKIIRPHHPRAVFLAMETIMTLIIDESDDISVDLLTSVLAGLRKKNQDIASMLGEKVITKCAAKLKPYLEEVMESDNITRDNYASIVASICGDESDIFEHAHASGSGDQLVTKELLPNAASPGEVLQAIDGISKSMSNGNGSTRNFDTDMNNNSSKKIEHCSVIQQSESTDALCKADPEISMEMELGTVPVKRGRKPNSLMNPEEGYDHSWIFIGRKTAKLSRERKPHEKGIDLELENAPPEEATQSLGHETEIVELSPKTGIKRGRPKKNATDISSLQIPKEELPNSENEKKSLSKDEVSLRMLSEGRSNEEVKQRKHPRKIGPAVKTVEDTSLPSAYLLPDEKAGSRCRPKGKLLKSTKIGSRNINKNSSLDQMDMRKRNLVCTVSDVDEDVAETSSIKKIKSSNRDGTYHEEISKTKLKRKRTPRKEVSPGAPDLCFKLIGRRIKVWWPLDKTFYDAVVDSYDHNIKKHRILYADGDVEILNLKKERWELIDNVLRNEDLETEIRRADSNDKPQKGKGLLAKSKSAKQSKRSESRSISKRKSRASSSKLAGGTTPDESEVDKAKEDYMKMLSTGTCIKSEQMTPEPASPFGDGS